MNVLFCGDSNVQMGIYLAILSMLKHTAVPLDVYVLTASVSKHKAIPNTFAETISQELDKSGGRIMLLDISEKFASYLPLANMNTRFTPLCMLRLFADEVSEIPDKILYLDTDVLCRGDFSDFYNTDMTGFEIAGVPDRYGKWFFGNILKHDYFNSGVLLLNMKAIRQSGLFGKCRAICRDKKMFMPDQSALNKLAKKLKVNGKYNCQGKIRKNTVFKHFTTFFKFLPYFRAVTVKPWDAARLHNVLRIYEFDDILDKMKEKF